MQINLTIRWYHLLAEAVIGLALMGVFALGMAQLHDWWVDKQARDVQVSRMATAIQATQNILNQMPLTDGEARAFKSVGFQVGEKVATVPPQQTSEEVGP